MHTSGMRLVCSYFVVTIFCRHLRSITEKMHGNMGSICRKYCLRACLHGGGGLQIGEVTCGGSPHLSYKREQSKMRDLYGQARCPTKAGYLTYLGSPSSMQAGPKC